MSNYYNRADAVALINLEIKADYEALELVDRIIETVKTFDGKVFNKRFETALQKNVSEHVYAHRNSYGHFEFYYSIPDRSVKSTASEYCYNYLDNSDVCLIVGDSSACFTEDNRINASVMIQMLEERRTNLQFQVCALESSLLMLGSLISEHEKLVSALKDFRDRIPSSIKNYVTELHTPSFY